jgi:hypothetical protein
MHAQCLAVKDSFMLVGGHWGGGLGVDGLEGGEGVCSSCIAALVCFCHQTCPDACPMSSCEGQLHAGE